MGAAPAGDGVLSLEVFAAKDSAGTFTGLMISVPPRCGLKAADTLHVSGFRVVALRGQSVLSICIPDLSEESRAKFVSLAASGQRLAVAEFMVLGLFVAYFLGVDVAE